MERIDLVIPGDTMQRLRESLGLKTNKQVVEEALTMLRWAAAEKQRGRVIFSAPPNGDSDIVKLKMACLEPKS
jgi:phenylalanyl-tRNA synthetase beta subunit